SLELTFQKPKGDIMVMADREKLKAAIFNVVDNSVKYTLKGQIDVRVSRGEGVEIIIHDTGIGMSAENIKTLFTRMFERDETAKKVAGGSGMGLYLAAQIIQAHHGKIWAESAGEGHGSVFHIELPPDSGAPVKT